PNGGSGASGPRKTLFSGGARGGKAAPRTPTEDGIWRALPSRPRNSRCTTNGRTEKARTKRLTSTAGSDRRQHRISLHPSCSNPDRPPDIALIVRRQPLIFTGHERRRDHKIGGCPIAGDRDIPDDGDSQQGFHIGIMGLRFQWIP